MTAINHALTGAVIGLTLHQPLLAIPVAFVSHFVLDGLPHHNGFWPVSDKRYRYYLLFELLSCISLVAVLAVAHPKYWLLASLCAFLATTPDFMWIGEFIAAQKKKQAKKPQYLLARLHTNVQWFQRPIGIVVEVIWTLSAVTVLATLLSI